MKQLLFYLHLFIFLVSVSCTPGVNLEEEAAVRLTLEGYIEAWAEKDISGFEDIFITDETLTIYEVRQIFHGWEAWISTIEDATWLDNGEHKQVTDMRVSWGLRKVGEEWKIVQAHWSIP